jgi:hypothetical protein
MTDFLCGTVSSDLYSFDGIALGHFNNKGHEAVANELYEYFKSQHNALFAPPLREGPAKLPAGL